MNECASIIHHRLADEDPLLCYVHLPCAVVPDTFHCRAGSTRDASISHCVLVHNNILVGMQCRDQLVGPIDKHSVCRRGYYHINMYDYSLQLQYHIVIR